MGYRDGEMGGAQSWDREMLLCLSCGAHRLPRHSVLAELNALKSVQGAESPDLFQRCLHCGQTHRVRGPAACEVLDSCSQLEEPLVWMVPPWESKSTEAENRMSWDFTDAFLHRLHRPVLRTFLQRLRSEKTEALLCASTSLSALRLGVPGEAASDAEPHLFFEESGHQIQAMGALAGQDVAFGPIDPADTLVAELIGRLCAEAHR